MSQANQTSMPRYAWVILAIVYLITVVATVMMNKVAPVMPVLMDAFEVDLAQVGFLVAVFGFTALILALPAGVLLQRLGVKMTGAVALGMLAVGAALGALSNSFGVMLAGRFLEGVGAALITILGPAAIAMWFPRGKIGMAMGIASTSIPISNFIALTLAPVLEPTIGWSGVWWVTCGMALVALVFFWVFIRPAPGLAKKRGDPDAPPRDKSTKRVYANKRLWLLGLAMMCFSFSFMSLVNYYPTFLNTAKGFALTQAGLMVGIMSLANIPGGPLAGWLSDKTGSRKLVILAGFALYALLIAFAFQISEGMLVLYMIFSGLFAVAAPTVILAAAPEIIGDPKVAGLSMAVVIFCRNVGIVFGPPTFGALVESTGWITAGYILVAAPVLGFLVVLLNKGLPARSAKQEDAVLATH